MNEVETDAQRAVAMTSTHPPTNPMLLVRWKYETSDEDLSNLIYAWMKYLAGQIKAYDCVNAHDKVYEKVQSGFYKSNS